MTGTTANLIHTLQEQGVLRHVMLQSYANLGIEQPRLLGRGPRLSDSDTQRLTSEIERIGADPALIDEAVERFGPEVQREQVAFHTHVTGHSRA